MLHEELIDLIDRTRRLQAEAQTVEVKAAHEGCPTKLYDTLSGFSNQDSGGVLLFGLDEKNRFAVVGVYDVQDLQKKVTEQCQQMTPQVRAVFTYVEIEGKTVCAAEIPAVDIAERPCYYSGKGRVKGSYVRVGDADLPMTDYEIYSYEAFRRRLHDDARPVERATLELLDGEKLQAYLTRMREARPGFASLSTEQAYEMLGITRDGVPTLSAVLNFGLYPQGYFPQLAITAVVVPGLEVGDTAADNARFLDNKRIEGTLSDMLAEALVFCKRNMKTRTIIDPATGARTDKPEYPIEAIREIVLNALIHRDYSHFTEGTPVQLSFFQDRLEVRSPGSLYGRVTVEDLGRARPDVRNTLLATMAEFLLQTENRYSGIPTVRREMKRAGLPEPVFVNRRDEFVALLYNGASKGSETPAAELDRARDILEFCRTPRTRREIAAYLDIRTVAYAMQRYVQPLVDAGELLMTIPDKPSSRKQRFVARQPAAQ